MIGDLIGGLVGSLLRGLVCGLLGSLIIISYFSREGTGNHSDDVRSTSRLCAVLQPFLRLEGGSLHHCGYPNCSIVVVLDHQTGGTFDLSWDR